MYSQITWKVEDGVATITLNRPEAMNALSLKMMEELKQALQQSGNDENIRAVVLTGAGKAFSVGGDLKWMESSKGERWEREFKKLVNSIHANVLSIRELEKPVIAALNGAVSGASFGIAMACDIKVASEKARLNQPYANIALTPDGGATFFLVRMLGMGRATELIFSSRIIDAGEALQLGLVQTVFPVETFEEEVSKIAEKYAHGPTLAYGRAKRLVNQAIMNDLEAQLDLEEDSIVKLSLNSDFKEGLSAFLEKRNPEFQGK